MARRFSQHELYKNLNILSFFSNTSVVKFHFIISKTLKLTLGIRFQSLIAHRNTNNTIGFQWRCFCKNTSQIA